MLRRNDRRRSRACAIMGAATVFMSRPQCRVSGGRRRGVAVTKRSVVVGGGVLGAATARHLAGLGDEVLLLESAPALGGLTASQQIQTSSGRVTCDRFYHVFLRGDGRARQWLRELELDHEVHWATVQSTCVHRGRAYPASSAVDLARLPFLGIITKLRTGLAVLLGALAPPGRLFDTFTADRWLLAMAGRQGTERLWRPLLAAKLGPYAGEVSAEFLRSTFRRLALARFQGRDGDLFGVVPGGYSRILQRAAEQLDRLGVRVHTGARVTSVERTEGGVAVSWTSDGHLHHADADLVVVTLPAPAAASILPGLAPDELERLRSVPYLGVVDTTVLLRVAPDPAYITYIVDDVPLTSVIGLHALVPPDETSGLFLVHLPRYSTPDDPLMQTADEQVRDQFVAALRQVYPSVADADVQGWAVNRARYVMPVPVRGYAARAPSFTTSIPGVLTVGSAQMLTGTLNVESSLELLERAIPAITATREGRS